MNGPIRPIKNEDMIIWFSMKEDCQQVSESLLKNKQKKTHTHFKINYVRSHMAGKYRMSFFCQSKGWVVSLKKKLKMILIS